MDATRTSIPRPLNEADRLAVLRQLAKQVMALIELRAKSEQLEATYIAMERLATIDELTGLLNRRALMAQLHKRLGRNRVEVFRAS